MKPEMDTTMVELRGVGMQWERNTALRDVNLTVCRGDFWAITGPNGGGKTTLMRIILRLLKPSYGDVIYTNRNLRVGYLPQKNLIDSRFPITVGQVIASGLREKDPARVAEMAELVGMAALVRRPIGEISGGQLQRTLFARAIISRPELLVLDEPLSYLDKHFEHRMYHTISDLAEHTTILLVSHEMSTIAVMANRHLIVDGTLHFCSAHHHEVHCDCDGEDVCHCGPDCPCQGSGAAPSRPARSGAAPSRPARSGAAPSRPAPHS